MLIKIRITMKPEPLLCGEKPFPQRRLTGLKDFFMQVHQLEHELSGMYPSSIAHGAGLAALWPSWARFVCPSDVNRFARYAVQVWNIDMDFDAQ